ncbi:MAG: hypothetical protein HQL56_02985 [Magnetococcales bacterium]|nr:hypothetical protein [Magnetococcales bacterium]
MSRHGLLDTLQKIHNLDRPEEEYRTVLSRYTDTELTQLENLTRLEKLTDAEFALLDRIVKRIYSDLVNLISAAA